MQSLLRNWSLVRIIKVGVGLACLISFPKHEEFIIVFVGLYLLVNGLLNAGCNNNNCAT
ncbi:MAG: hypothetical protein GQ574_24500 [Crocinitomix sp.]|nr:hypothetical protein [Crocinitomix sp.]